MEVIVKERRIGDEQGKPYRLRLCETQSPTLSLARPRCYHTRSLRHHQTPMPAYSGPWLLLLALALYGPGCSRRLDRRKENFVDQTGWTCLVVLPNLFFELGELEKGLDMVIRPIRVKVIIRDTRVLLEKYRDLQILGFGGSRTCQRRRFGHARLRQWSTKRGRLCHVVAR